VTELRRHASQLQTADEQAWRALDALPSPLERTEEHQRAAARVHEQVRVLRCAVLAAHAETIHHELTGGGSHCLRIPELLGVAAQRYPGLVPPPDRLAAERALPQPRKDGLEVDQGLFLGAMFAHPVAGTRLLHAMLQPAPDHRPHLDHLRRTGRCTIGVVDVHREGTVGYVTVRNTGCLNAEDDALGRDLELAIDAVLLDPAIHVGVLRGGEQTHPRYAGRRVFSAGINLTHLYQGKISFAGFVVGREAGYVHKLLRGIRLADGTALEKPWVAAVDTFAIGGGMQLLLVFDRVVAAQGATFSLPAAKEGIIPGAANLRLTRHTGARLARQIILGGRTLTAGEPCADTICDVVVPADDVGAAAAEQARQLDNAATVPNRRMLHLAEEPLDSLRCYLAAFVPEQARRLYSPDVLTTLEKTWMARQHR
jgi:(3,5-dihydroxyphenyl)acetyl-CoA 1,2-dioxygenase